MRGHGLVFPCKADETDLLIPSYVTTLSNKFSYATNKGDVVKSQS
jgi:hypothetical protein